MSATRYAGLNFSDKMSSVETSSMINDVGLNIS